MYGYRASFNWFDEIVLPDGRVVRKSSLDGGGAIFFVTKFVVDIDAYMREADNDGHDADWIEMSEGETLNILARIDESG